VGERNVMGFRRVRFVVLREVLGGEMEKLTGGGENCKGF